MIDEGLYDMIDEATYDAIVHVSVVGLQKVSVRRCMSAMHAARYACGVTSCMCLRYGWSDTRKCGRWVPADDSPSGDHMIEEGLYEMIDEAAYHRMAR